MKTPPSPGDGNGVGHNSKKAEPLELTDEERQALALQHKDHYEKALARKKATDAEFKNACKSARAALGPKAVELIKDMILVTTDEGAAQLRDRARRAAVAARYMSASLGHQFDIFDAEPAGEDLGTMGEEATA